jgi:hypothetical protein
LNSIQTIAKKCRTETPYRIPWATESAIQEISGVHLQHADPNVNVVWSQFEFRHSLPVVANLPQREEWYTHCQDLDALHTSRTITAVCLCLENVCYTVCD